MVSHDDAFLNRLDLTTRLALDATDRCRHKHDLRHTMVVRRIQDWHAHDLEADAEITVLATYLGQIEAHNTYWYLSAVPELMGIVADGFEAFATDAPAGLS